MYILITVIKKNYNYFKSTFIKIKNVLIHFKYYRLYYILNYIIRKII